MAELLFWPALIAYGEAAVAYVGVLRRPELATRLAIWGVRIGWLAQTCLLAVEAWQADGFPWADWAGALNLFDAQPPFAEVGFLAGYDGSQADLRQRFWYLKLAKKF